MDDLRRIRRAQRKRQGRGALTCAEQFRVMAFAQLTYHSFALSRFP